MAQIGFAGRVALVTGGARRIGRSVALRLAAEGAMVVVNYRSSEAEASELVREIHALHAAKQAATTGAKVAPRAVAMQADVTRHAEVKNMFAAIESEFGRLDILVNNAGEFFKAKFEEISEEQWDGIMATNLKSQFLCAQAAVPLMKRQGRGHIVNISSLGGLLAWPGYTHYCVSKAGVVMLTRCMAAGLGPEILVNSVAPGTIQFQGEEPDAAYIQRVPLHRTGTGDDIADAVVYFASSDFVTGQILAVDGGRLLV
jgi:3-oxoacyl-[acyl-carrier protein] reductase/pteridine reductase